MRGRGRFWPAVLLPALLLSGCGYQLVGQTRSLPADIHTVAVLPFKNNSEKPGLDRTLTDAVKQAFINDGRLKLAGPASANLVVRADILSYVLQPVSFNASDVVNDYRLHLVAEVTVRDQVHKKLWLKQRLSTETDFKVSSNVASSDQAETDATRQGSQDFAQQFLSLVMEGF